MLSAFDFWYTKNISGRFLVGLRWWNEVDEEGNEKWIFESEEETKQKYIDYRIFWTSLYITPIYWGIFFVFNILSDWIRATVCLISMILSGTNLLNYQKCSKDQSNKVSEYLVEKGSSGIGKLIERASASQV